MNPRIKSVRLELSSTYRDRNATVGPCDFTTRGRSSTFPVTIGMHAIDPVSLAVPIHTFRQNLDARVGTGNRQVQDHLVGRVVGLRTISESSVELLVTLAAGSVVRGNGCTPWKLGPSYYRGTEVWFGSVGYVIEGIHVSTPTSATARVILKAPIPARRWQDTECDVRIPTTTTDDRDLKTMSLFVPGGSESDAAYAGLVAYNEDLCAQAALVSYDGSRALLVIAAPAATSPPWLPWHRVSLRRLLPMQSGKVPVHPGMTMLHSISSSQPRGLAAGCFLRTVCVDSAGGEWWDETRRIVAALPGLSWSVFPASYREPAVGVAAASAIGVPVDVSVDPAGLLVLTRHIAGHERIPAWPALEDTLELGPDSTGPRSAVKDVYSVVSIAQAVVQDPLCSGNRSALGLQFYTGLGCCLPSARPALFDGVTTYDASTSVSLDPSRRTGSWFAVRMPVPTVVKVICLTFTTALSHATGFYVQGVRSSSVGSTVELPLVEEAWSGTTLWLLVTDNVTAYTTYRVVSRGVDPGETPQLVEIDFQCAQITRMTYTLNRPPMLQLPARMWMVSSREDPTWYWELLPYSYDNAYCTDLTMFTARTAPYSVRILDMQIPNLKLKSSQGGTVTSYPFLTLELATDNGSKVSLYTGVAGNVQRRGVPFRLTPIGNGAATRAFVSFQSSWALDADLDMGNGLRCTLKTPDDEVVEFMDRDLHSPWPPLDKLQISLSLELTLL